MDTMAPGSAIGASHGLELEAALKRIAASPERSDTVNPAATISDTPKRIAEPSTDMFWGISAEDMFDDGTLFDTSMPDSHDFKFDTTLPAPFTDALHDREAEPRAHRPSLSMHDHSPHPYTGYFHNHTRSIPENQTHNHMLFEESYHRESTFGEAGSYNGMGEARFDIGMGAPMTSSSLESHCPSVHGSVQSSTNGFNRLNHRQRVHASSQSHQVAATKCLVVVTKLQRMAREAQNVTVDVLLATNKSAVAEINAILHAEIRNDNEGRGSQFSDYFSSRNSYGNEGLANPVGLMIYVIAMQYVVDLYAQACHLFLTQQRHDSGFSSPGSSSSSSAGSGSANVSKDGGRGHAGLPQLDFGTFKIDVADQRRLFAEIIGRELGTALGVCERLRDGLVDMSAPTGVLEETFLGIEMRLRRLMEQIRCACNV